MSTVYWLKYLRSHVATGGAGDEHAIDLNEWYIRCWTAPKSVLRCRTLDKRAKKWLYMTL